LIKSVQTHTLIHAGDFNFPGSTGEIDYLTEETANIGNLPDTIYFSNGTTAPVNSATEISSSPDGADTYTVTASNTGGSTTFALVVTINGAIAISSSISSPSRNAERGVCSAGLRTTVQPVARAGPSFQAAISSGKFQGIICPTTPTGSRTV